MQTQQNQDEFSFVIDRSKQGLKECYVNEKIEICTKTWFERILSYLLEITEGSQ